MKARKTEDSKLQSFSSSLLHFILRRLEATTTSTSTASTSTTQVSGSSGEGGPTAGESALTGPSPTVVDSPLVIPPELGLAGPSGSTEEVPPSASEEVPLSASQRKLGSLGEKGSTSGEELQGRRVLDLPTVANAIETGVVFVIVN